ncbi:sigma factor-like helix-turn-helix DNA-binding protein [Mycolicibacterium sp. 120266]|uniref:sigma factor-like helix-turn-helix DNA-binding protein n=1 Tax=Mycolicibacterium sp. 120266 TaxID=3090601 RepID=UPI00299EE12A|nr:sigma factor-like helix-turn-helix DNA-binding protein [Mycolicibacterium sp. 120266]MDX1876166.1 sigma factor-like helix-turn-helix DNA-binding protein [Mycolicibacterium sp. 120266]
MAALRPLIRALPEPARTIVVELVMNGRTRAEVGRELNITGQWVGQILTQTLLALRDQASRDPKFASYFVERKKP